MVQNAMMTFFRNVSTRVDYGEQECCREQSLLYVAEYQEYLYCEGPDCPASHTERPADATSIR